jgi:hypothetical protein
MRVGRRKGRRGLLRGGREGGIGGVAVHSQISVGLGGIFFLGGGGQASPLSLEPPWEGFCRGVQGEGGRGTKPETPFPCSRPGWRTTAIA